MHSLKGILLFLAFLSLAGCSSGNPATPTVNQAPASVSVIDYTNPALYRYATTSDVNGYANLTQGLIAEGVIVNGSDIAVFVGGVNAIPLSLMNVDYWVDQSDPRQTVYLKVSDPNQVQIPIFRTIPLSVIAASSAQPAAGFIWWIVRWVARLFSRSSTRVKTLDLVKSIDAISTAHSLLTLDLQYSNETQELVYQGTLVDFISVFARVPSLNKVPMALRRNIDRRNNTATKDRSVTVQQANPVRAEQDVLRYVKSFADFAFMANSTPITITVHHLDGKPMFSSVDFPASNIGQQQMYTVDITVSGNPAYVFESYAPPHDIHNAPDFMGYVDIGNIQYPMTLQSDSLWYRQTLPNISIAMGEYVTFVVEDKDQFSPLAKDAFPAEPVFRFSLPFDGRLISRSNEKASITVRFIPTVP